LVKEFVSKAIKITWVIFLGKEKYRSTDTLGEYHPLHGYSFLDGYPPPDRYLPFHSGYLPPPRWIPSPSVDIFS